MTLAAQLARQLAARAQWRPLELVLLLAAPASLFVLPRRPLVLPERVLVVLFLAFLVARRLMNSPFGLALRAIKGNSLRATAIGIGVDARLIAIYTFAAGYAGIAGALLTQTTQFASLDVLSFERSADVLLVLILGGTGYLYGGLIGAVVFKLVQDALINFTAQYWQFWIGLVLVLIVLGGDRARRIAAAAAGQIGRRLGLRPKLDAEAP